MLDRLIATRMSNEEASLLVPYAIAGLDAMIYSSTDYVLGQPRFYTKTHLFHLYIKA
jgi:hypothetical protein